MTAANISKQLLITIMPRRRAVPHSGGRNDALDSDAECSGGSLDFHYVSGLSANKSGADRGVAGDFSLFEIHLVVAHNGVGHLPVCPEMGEFNFAQKGYTVFRQGFRVDDSRMLQHFLQKPDTADGLALRPSGGSVFKVLAQIPLCAGFGKLVPDLGILHIYQVVEFRDDFVEPFF